jgi:hypothetical protein
VTRVLGYNACIRGDKIGPMNNGLPRQYPGKNRAEQSYKFRGPLLLSEIVTYVLYGRIHWGGVRRGAQLIGLRALNYLNAERANDLGVAQLPLFPVQAMPPPAGPRFQTCVT